MLIPGCPADEAGRLSALRALAILDTPPEEGFDRLTRLACRLFGTPMAAVSLIDSNRQWFKAREGLSVAETPREVSFCGHAILHDGVFLVPDAHQDPRFADNPLVTGEPGLRFYAGHVLRGRDGHALGTLCVMDHAAREFGPEDRRALADLAAAAMTELDRRRADWALARQLTHMQLLEVIAVGANEAVTPAEAIHVVLSRVCAVTGWSAGRYWAVDAATGLAEPTGDRHLEPDAACSAALDGPADRALVHRVLATGYPAIRDALDAPEADGLAPAFACPAIAGEALLGVLEFFGSAIEPPDELLLDVMSHVGALLGQVLERLQTQEVLTASQRQLAEAQELAQLGSWEWDALGDSLHMSAALCRMNGFAPGAAPRTLQAYWASIHVEDRAHLAAFTRDEVDAFVDRTPYEARIVRPDGETRLMTIRQEAVRDADGRLIKLFGTAQDVTERREAELARERSERMHRLLAEHATDIISLAGPDGALHYVSRACERILGHAPEAFMGLGWLDFLHPDDRAAATGPRTYDGGYVYRARHRDGHYVWLEAHMREFVDPDTGHVERVSVTRDITERKRDAARLEASGRQLALSQALAHLGSWELDLATLAVSWSDEMCRLLGYEPDQAVPAQDTFFAQVHDEDRAALWASGEPLLAGEVDSVTFDYRLRRADGQWRMMRGVTSVLFDDAGRAVTMLGTAQDITDIKAAEQEKRESEELVRSIVESSHDAILLTDETGVILNWNYGAERIFGFDADEAVGRNVTLVMPDRYRELHRAGLRDAGLLDPAALGRTIEVTGRRKSGHEFPAELSMASWSVRGKRFFSGIIRDMTERREMERLKSEFVTIVSHELRTPINTMMGALELLSTGMVGELPPRAARMVEIAFGNTGRLKRLVNDMLDIQLLEWGRLPLHFERADAAALMREAVDAVQAQAERLGLSLEWAPVHAPVLADPDRIVQTLTNLLTNAVKYTPAGGRVWLGATIGEEEVTFEVGDTGRGIPSDDLPRVFEKYEQVAPGDAREKGGAGLGLAIARAIVERHQGRLWAESAVGEGSRFRFTLPVATVTAPAEG